MKRIFLLVAAAALFSVSCEQHDFKETRKLHDHGHSAHGDADHGKNAEDH